MRVVILFINLISFPRSSVSVIREEFRVQPKSLRVAAGDTALLECGPPRGHPEPTLVWKKNGHPIDFENSKR